MQNKSIIWLFISLLALATLYVFSFSMVTSNFEKQAKDYAASYSDSLAGTGLSGAALDTAVMELEKKYLRDSSEAKIYPVVGHSYSYLKEHQLNLGLDLKGGMSVTLEVSIPDLVVALSDGNQNVNFRNAVEEARKMQTSSTDDYITLFEKAWKQQNAGTELWRIFSSTENMDKFPPKSSDDDIIKVLRAEANDAINNTENIIRKRIDQFGVTQPNVQKLALGGRILVELPGVDEPARVRKLLKSTANLEFWETYFAAEALPLMKVVNDELGKTQHPELFLGDSSSITDTTKIEGDSLKTAAADSTQKDSLSVEDLRKKNPLFALLDTRGIMNNGCIVGRALSSDTARINRMLRSPEAKRNLPAEMRLQWGSAVEQNVATLYAIKDASLKGKAELDGSSITDARQDFQQISGKVIISMSMSADKGAPIWRRMTEKAAADNKRCIAVTMDNLVLTAPSVNEAIPNGRSEITMGGDGDRNKQITEAADLAGLLKAGSLPAPARIVDEVTVGPTLGEENIKSGMWSFIIAFIAILIYMIFYYAWAGVAANIALIANLFFLMGALVSMGGVLTMPGIAGIVLTIGMAVDANVIIYERVREELRGGKSVAAALKDGYSKALSAIIDGNVTTFLTGVVLYVIGSGPIRGFATTLMIGIVTSLFTAIVISRLVFYYRLDRKKTISFDTNITRKWFTNFHYDFVGKRKRFYVISAIVIAAGIGSYFTQGFNYGVEFDGGTSYTVQFNGSVEAEAIREALGSTMGSDAVNTVQSVATSDKTFKIVTSYMINSTDENQEAMIEAKVKEALAKVNVPYNQDFEKVSKVDPSMSDDFRRDAILSTIFALLIIGIYITIRFRRFNYAVGATIALFHDVLVVLASYTLLKNVVPFSLEVNQVFIGALLTVVGYSINDTVVIFDRIREYLGARKNIDTKQLINDALNSTLGRTINTSLTVFITLLIMFIFGSDDIKGFCFALLIGVISGTYSTLFIAVPVVVDLGAEKKSAEVSAL
jgi:SecD/SecF fusion protein